MLSTLEDIKFVVMNLNQLLINYFCHSDKTGIICGSKTASKTVSTAGDRMTQIASKSGSKTGSKTKSKTRSKTGETSPPFDTTPDRLWLTRAVFAFH
jgi:hypothetical protein